MKQPKKKSPDLFRPTHQLRLLVVAFWGLSYPPHM